MIWADGDTEPFTLPSFGQPTRGSRRSPATAVSTASVRLRVLREPRHQERGAEIGGGSAACVRASTPRAPSSPCGTRPTPASSSASPNSRHEARHLLRRAGPGGFRLDAVARHLRLRPGGVLARRFVRLGRRNLRRRHRLRNVTMLETDGDGLVPDNRSSQDLTSTTPRSGRTSPRCCSPCSRTAVVDRADGVDGGWSSRPASAGESPTSLGTSRRCDPLVGAFRRAQAERSPDISRSTRRSGN